MEVQKPGRGRNRVKPPPPDAQAKKLEALAKEVDRANEIYDEARKHQESHQKQMTRMLEETVKHIKDAHNQVSRVAQDVKGTTGAHTAKFKKGLGLTKDALKNDLDAAAAILDESINALDGRMTEMEAALEKQRHDSVAHIDATLGEKLQVEVTQLQKALVVEQKNRRLQFEREEKLISDEIEDINRLLDAEKFSREQQLMASVRWAGERRQQLTKRQNHIEKETRSAVNSLQAQHATMIKERIQSHHKVMESITTFVHRYRQQIDADLSPTAPAAVVDGGSNCGTGNSQQPTARPAPTL